MKPPFGLGKKKAAKGRSTGNTGISSQMKLLAILGLLLVFIPTIAVYWNASGHLTDVESQRAQLSAQRAVGPYQEWVTRQASIAELLAKDPEIRQIIASGQTRVNLKKFSGMFSGASQVRVFAAGLEGTSEADANLSYAAMDMLRQSESSAMPPSIEMHTFGAAQQINLVRRVLDSSGQRLLGHLMVTFPASLLQGMATAQQMDGYLELQQIVGGAPLMIGHSGDPSLKFTETVALEKVSGSGWQIAYWPTNNDDGVVAILLSVAVMASGIAAALWLLGIFYVNRKMLAAHRKDQATCLTIVKDMRDGQIKSVYPSALSENHDTMELMTRAAVSGLADTASASVIDNGADDSGYEVMTVDDDSTRLLFDESALEIEEAATEKLHSVNKEIFRAYDIRGIVDQSLSVEDAYEIGRSIGSEAYFRGEQTIVVGRDGRLSSEALTSALIRGLRDTGRDIKDVGEVPTPVLYFAADQLGSNSGVMVTGSHNPSDYNGFKIVLGGETLAGDAIQSLYQRIESGDLLTGEGSLEHVEVTADYIERISGDIKIAKPVKVVIDCGNGVAGAVAPKLFEALGCEVVELFCEVDGNFPNHHPDPGKEENLSVLIETVKTENADLGIAFDGDGDRLGVVTAEGEIIWPDRLMILYAIDLLSRNPGAQIIYDVKCTRQLASSISENGGQGMMSASGHSLMKAKMQESGALLAGEMSGHIYFAERWFGFDDGLYAAARLLEILTSQPKGISDAFSALPQSFSTPELGIPMEEGEPKAFMDKLLNSAHFENADISTVDGMRVEFKDGWGLVRASNTTPSLMLRFEADHEIAMSSVQEEFRRVMTQVDAGIKLPF